MVNDSTIPRQQYTLAGAGEALSFDFYVLREADLKVYLTEDGATTYSTLVLDTDYTVSGTGDEDGNVTVTLDGSVGAADDVVTVVNMGAIDQLLDVLFRGKTTSESLETALDKLTLIALGLQEQINRAILYPPTEVSGWIAEIIDKTSRASGWMKFDANGDFEIDTTTIAGLVATAYANADIVIEYFDTRNVSPDPITLPANPSEGQVVRTIDKYFNAGTNNGTVERGDASHKINNAAADWTVAYNGAVHEFQATVVEVDGDASESVTVSGATAGYDINGVYESSGTTNMKPDYWLDFDTYSVRIYWSTPVWNIVVYATNKTTILQSPFVSSDNVATPDLVTTWAVFSGGGDLPTVEVTPGVDTINWVILQGS